MGYEIYVEHPESRMRQQQDFNAWSVWAPQNAPWTGVGISDQASVLQAFCGDAGAGWDDIICKVLDTGGLLSVPGVEKVWRQAGVGMTEKVREVFAFAREHGYPLRVVFSKGFGSLTASAYLAKHGSA
jgi:hypothetical protein